MSHAYVKCLVHTVFSTKGRERSIADTDRLWHYIGGIARDNGFVALAVGGTADHVHALLSLPSTMPVCRAVQLIKAGSSKWLSDAIPSMRRFEWQKGYGAFSIGVSQVDDTLSYIRNQAEHHRRHTFEEEYRAFLKRNRIEVDERYVFG